MTMEFMAAMTSYVQASQRMAEHHQRILDGLVDQITELVETTDDADVQAGWASRLAMMTFEEEE